MKGRLEDTQLPTDKVDIVVSEWMGYFLLFEAMVDSVIYARDVHLKPDGIVLPNRCTISLVGCSDKGKMRTFKQYHYPLQLHFIIHDFILYYLSCFNYKNLICFVVKFIFCESFSV